MLYVSHHYYEAHMYVAKWLHIFVLLISAHPSEEQLCGFVPLCTVTLYW